MEGASLYGRLLAFPGIIRLDHEGLPGTNTLAYSDSFVSYEEKRFM